MEGLPVCQVAIGLLTQSLRRPVGSAAGASRLGWMGDIETADRANAHAVGELGRLDPAYVRSEHVRAQARALARASSTMEDVFEKVTLYPESMLPRAVG